MQRFLDLFISINRAACFRRFLRPSSGAQNCKQYWFNNTWRCMYSFVLLMMGGGTAWNMQSDL